MVGTTILCALAFLFIDANRAEAQGAGLSDSHAGLLQIPIGVQNVANTPADPEFPSSPGSPFRWDNGLPSAKRHVLIGAGVGAAAGAILGLIVMSQDKSGYFDTWHVVAGPTLVGGAAGALAGYLVSLARR